MIPEIIILALTIYMESRGEPLQGKTFFCRRFPEFTKKQPYHWCGEYQRKEE